MSILASEKKRKIESNKCVPLIDRVRIIKGIVENTQKLFVVLPESMPPPSFSVYLFIIYFLFLFSSFSFVSNCSELDFTCIVYFKEARMDLLAYRNNRVREQVPLCRRDIVRSSILRWLNRGVHQTVVSLGRNGSNNP